MRIVVTDRSGKGAQWVVRELREAKGRETLLTIDRTRRLPRCEPAYRWADHVSQ